MGEPIHGTTHFQFSSLPPTPTQISPPPYNMISTKLALALFPLLSFTAAQLNKCQISAINTAQKIKQNDNALLEACQKQSRVILIPPPELSAANMKSICESDKCKSLYQKYSPELVDCGKGSMLGQFTACFNMGSTTEYQKNPSPTKRCS